MIGVVKVINLITEKKCENCPYFRVEQESTDITNLSEKYKNYLHDLKCKNYSFCGRLEEYLREVIANE